MDSTGRDVNTQRSSASSALTEISTTDISSHGERDDEEEEKDETPRNTRETGHRSQMYVSSAASSGSGHSRELTAKLSDVEVSLEGVANISHATSDSDPPPPLPSSPPPSLDTDDRGKCYGSFLLHVCVCVQE